MSKFFNARTIATMGLLIAMNIIFVRLLRIGEGYIRISLGFFPICVAGMIFGPIGGGITAILSDIIGMLLFARGDIYFPLFTLTEFLYGFGFGLMLHNKRLSPIKLSLLVSLQFIILNLIIQTIWLYIYFIVVVGSPKGFIPILTGRLITSLVNLPMQLIGVNLVASHLKKPLARMGIIKLCNQNS